MRSSKPKISTVRHSLAHILAHAVLDLFPGTKLGIGPAIETGFYYDFLFSKPISEKDLERIEKRMRELIANDLVFKKSYMTRRQALRYFKDQPFKRELIRELPGEKVSIYTVGEFVDLCKGPHVRRTSQIPTEAFKLDKIAGAYWKGDEKREQLTRIYGLAFETKEGLEKYLWQREEAKKRDHKRLGTQLDLFLFSEDVGPGLPIFTPKGWIVRKKLEEFVISEKKKLGYQFVWTPHLTKSQLYVRSGHWQKYDAMFPSLRFDEEEWAVKPMNCPHHFQIYLKEQRSYRDLPLRLAENATVYRYEKSGELNGLLRVRALTQDDTHIFLRHSQIEGEIISALGLIEKILKTFSFSDFVARISTRDPKNKKAYLGEDKVWQKAERALKRAVKQKDFEWFEGKGEAAFYGPKIDVVMRDSLGREWQLSTVQLDFNQPVNFDMWYITETGKKERPAILHIAMLGSFERFMAILLEHLKGELPPWLSPVQVAVIPVSQKHQKYGQRVARFFDKEGMRVELWDDAETVSKKIRRGELQKIPYLVVVGAKEEREKRVAVRIRHKGQESFSLSEFVEYLKRRIEKKTLKP